MSNITTKTDYTMQSIENSSWMRIFKGGKVFSLCIDKNAGLHSIWVEEGRVAGDYYVVDEDGCVYKVEKGEQ